jgi:hypothetical protein
VAVRQLPRRRPCSRGVVLHHTSPVAGATAAGMTVWFILAPLGAPLPWHSNRTHLFQPQLVSFMGRACRVARPCCALTHCLLCNGLHDVCLCAISRRSQCLWTVCSVLEGIASCSRLCCACVCNCVCPVQNIAVPLDWEKAGGVAAVKRYVAQLQDVGTQVGTLQLACQDMTYPPPPQSPSS